MPVKVIEEPVVEPVSLDELKEHIVQDSSVGTDDDRLLRRAIVACRKHAENITRRAYVPRTLLLGLPCWGEGCIELPQPPFISIEYVKYKDADGVLTLVDAALYQVDDFREPALIKPAYMETWPLLSRNDFNMVQIAYRAGYNPVGSPTDWASGVPDELKEWVLLRAGTLYEQRAAVITGTIVTELPRNSLDVMLDGLCVDTF